MTSSSEEDDVAVLWWYNRRRKHKRRFWIHPYLYNNFNMRLYKAAQEVEDPVKFQKLYRMSAESFIVLVRIVGPSIKKMDTKFRDSIEVEERLLITLRYLATGNSFTDLSLYFMRGISTISNVVSSTTEQIWICLNADYMKLPTEEEWIRVADRFYELWNLPNCIGAIDGKHVRIQKPPKSGSSYFNYKGYHSIVLLACCDADGCFTMIEVGHAGRNSDGGILHASRIGRWLKTNKEGLHIPDGRILPHDNNGITFPFYFVGDEAFPLQTYLLRPFPRKALDDIKRIYNYRISRARKTVECTFGMASKKFQVLMKPIMCENEKTINSIIRAVCILHNFIRKREGKGYEPRPNYLQNIVVAENRRTASNLRNYIANYFIKPETTLPWQWKYCINQNR